MAEWLLPLQSAQLVLEELPREALLAAYYSFRLARIDQLAALVTSVGA